MIIENDQLYQYENMSTEVNMNSISSAVSVPSVFHPRLSDTVCLLCHTT